MCFLKKFFQKFLFIFFIFIFVFPYVFSDIFANNIPNSNAKFAIVYDRKTKQILYGKNENIKAKMASTTKIMTAIIIIENCKLDDTTTISEKASKIRGSRLGLKKGDKITVEHLLYGLMLKSGNDCAVALAEYHSGDVKIFCDQMNKKAKELNLVNTNFESPHGLDSENHFTTAYELAKLSDYALKNPIFSKIVNTKFYSVTINNCKVDIKNSNELLGNLDGIYGVKTGFTNGANRCLVSSYKKGNFDFITVVLGCDTKKNRTNDSVSLINYIEKNFTYFNVNQYIDEQFFFWKKQHIHDFEIKKAKPSSLHLSYKKSNVNYIALKNSEINSLTLSINVPFNLSAPIKKDSIIGTLELLSNKKTLYKTDIIISNNIYKKDFCYYFSKNLKNNFKFMSSLFELQ